MLNGAQYLRESVNMAAFRSRLRQLMLEQGVKTNRQISQSEVSRQTGVSLPTIQRWYDPEYTFNRVDADTVYCLLDYFECKFEDLIERVSTETKRGS